MKAALTGSRELWCEANREELRQSPLLGSYALADTPLGEQLNPAEHGRVRETDRFLVERNRNWIPRIQRMLDEPGSVFILVGGAHLAGDDSILRLLAAEGLAVQRIQASKAP